MPDRMSRGPHQNCIWCGAGNPCSYRLLFAPFGNDSVRGVFRGTAELQGYSDTLHGGVIASLLDAAMTHCLFQAGVEGVTADLHIRYRHPVPCAAKVAVQARLIEKRSPRYELTAELLLGRRVMARADARFMRRRHSGTEPMEPLLHRNTNQENRNGRTSQ